MKSANKQLQCQVISAMIKRYPQTLIDHKAWASLRSWEHIDGTEVLEMLPKGWDT